MNNLQNDTKAKQEKCLHNIINSETDKWNVIGKYWLTSFDAKFTTVTNFFSLQMFRYLGNRFNQRL